MVFLKGMGKIFVFLFSKIIIFFIYSKKYIGGRHFKSKYSNIPAKGWRWIVNDFFGRLLLGTNKGVIFPVSPLNTVIGSKNIFFDVNDLNNFQGKGKYFQAYNGAKIVIGSGTMIANNVGLITSNHNLKDISNHLDGSDIIIGNKCWIGMNSIILPGVRLSDGTVVGAGSVVTKSFCEGNCVIAGNPAVVIKKLDSD